MRKLSDDSKKKIIDVPYLNQLDVVFGCEAVSATMVLQFYGCDLSWRDFTDSYLIRRDWRIDNGVIYGPDPLQRIWSQLRLWLLCPLSCEVDE